MEDQSESEDSFEHTDNYATSFIDEQFLSQGLSFDNALKYFSISPFYSEGEGISIELDDTTNRPDFFKIIKYWTHSGNGEEYVKDVVAVYYVINGTIYQCPDLYSLLKYRMVL